MKLILLGAPGSGKGTQAVVLAKNFKIRKISLGDILREEVKKDSELGRKVKQYMEQGVLVPDEVVGAVIEENIKDEGFVLDGYPRNLAQAENLQKIFERKHIQITAVVYLDVTTETVVKRLSGRRICPQCGANFHITNMPPKVEGVCDACGSKLIQRKDDNPEVIEKRIEVFEAESAPLKDYYQKEDNLLVVDANKDAQEVFMDISSLLKNG
ncbi:MAG: adenylate kinase [Candidatus Omnitrophica bacterium]|nr:adenylate kinase [Candidatus Omnitrophota bacterium]